jgi:hypothetical protein
VRTFLLVQPVLKIRNLGWLSVSLYRGVRHKTVKSMSFAQTIAAIIHFLQPISSAQF